MYAAKQVKYLLFVMLLASTSLTFSPLSVTHAQQKLYLPTVQTLDKCVDVQLAEPVGDFTLDCPPPGSSSGVARADYNGDGFSDLAAGIARKDGVRAGKTLEDSGAVSIIYGSSDGLTSHDNQLWTPESPDISGQSEAHDYFGSALAAGNFNGDKYSDLAIGIAGKDISGASNAGAVQVLYGSATGLSAAGNQFWIQGAGPSGTLLDKPEQNDRFGSSLAWGDFNHDGFGDLAVGIVFEDIANGSGGNSDGAGAVQILYGSASGLQAAGNQFWNQESSGIDGVSEAGDEFGYTLSGGDLNGDHFADLAIGVPDEDISAGGGVMRRNAGSVNVLYGSANGLAANAGPGDQGWSQGSSGIQGSVEAEDHFGMSLAVGDFNHDGRSDLAVGVPYEDVGDTLNAGSVNVIYGSSTGLKATGNEIFDQDSSGTDGEVDDNAEPNDLFGAALAAGDFDGDSFQDLAVGVPLEDIRVYDGVEFDDFNDTGAVNLLVGYPGGLTTAPNNFLFARDRYHPNAPCCMAYGTHFGQSLTAWNFGKGSQVDLAVGTTGGYNFVAAYEGVINIFYSPLSLENPKNELWNQESSGIRGDSATGDQFGLQLY